MMAKKMYLSASSKKLQVHAKYVFHATVHVFTENYCSWLCMCDLEAEGKIDMFMLGQKIILLFLFLPLTILFQSLKVHSFLLKRNKTCGIHAKILLMHEFFLQL